jgi:hypothetical protein
MKILSAGCRRGRTTEATRTTRGWIKGCNKKASKNVEEAGLEAVVYQGKVYIQ